MAQEPVIQPLPTVPVPESLSLENVPETLETLLRGEA
jgi:hypothetical protein